MHITTNRYSSLSIGMRWLMLLLLIAVYAVIELHDAFPKDSDLRAQTKTWHYMLGLCVLVLVAVRLATRLVSCPAPRIVPESSPWQQRLAGWMRLALYLFMVAMPLLGWLLLSAEGDPIPFFGLQLPPLLGESKASADLLKDIHETIAAIGYWLIGLHAAAALFHHHLMHDNTLVGMLPRRS